MRAQFLKRLEADEFGAALDTIDRSGRYARYLCNVLLCQTQGLSSRVELDVCDVHPSWISGFKRVDNCFGNRT